jgi:hypothetical protein
MRMEWDAEIARDAAAGKFDALGQWVIRWGVAFKLALGLGRFRDIEIFADFAGE